MQLVDKKAFYTSLISKSVIMKSIISEKEKKNPLLLGHIQFNKKILF